MYCTKCGQQVDANQKFCTRCGFSTDGSGATPIVVMRPAANHTWAFKKLAKMERTSATIWTIIAIYQLLIPFPTTIFLGVWNLVQASRTRKFAKSIEANHPARLYPVYLNQVSSLVLSLIWNLLFGGVFGFIAIIYEFHIRSFVLKNQDIFK